ncbi:Uncharacterised protein [Candidatus Anstonella stagnisolia]|nr:Uncharacterised protein [Candidatus Anstonella stagnisolia]
MFSKPQFIDCRIREKVSSLPNVQKKRYLSRVFGKLMQSEDSRVVGCLTKLPDLIGKQRTKSASSRLREVVELRSKIGFAFYELRIPPNVLYAGLHEKQGLSLRGFMRNCERAGITPSEIFSSFGTENIGQQLSAMRYANYHIFNVAVGLKNCKFSRLKTAKLLNAHFIKGLNASSFDSSLLLARTLHYICTSPNAIASILKKLGFSSSEAAFGLYSVPGHEHYYKLPERKMPVESINPALARAGYALDEIKFEPGMIEKIVETKESIDYYYLISGLTPIQYATQISLLMADHVPNFVIASPYPRQA